MAFKVRRNSRGIEAVAKSDAVRAEVTKVAEHVADMVRAQGHRVEGIPGDVSLPVEVTSYTTDRARSSVTIKHASGQAVQAKHGSLTKAAAQAGLDVRSKR
jgi:hypothetical protein